MELVSESTFKDMVSELGLAAAMQPETEYTLLAPLNGAFTGGFTSVVGSGASGGKKPPPPLSLTCYSVSSAHGLG